MGESRSSVGSCGLWTVDQIGVVGKKDPRIQEVQATVPPLPRSSTEYSDSTDSTEVAVRSRLCGYSCTGARCGGIRGMRGGKREGSGGTIATLTHTRPCAPLFPVLVCPWREVWGGSGVC